VKPETIISVPLQKHGIVASQEKAREIYARAAELGSSEAHFFLGIIYDEGGEQRK
jgi:TPR repeat protein